MGPNPSTGSGKSPIRVDKATRKKNKKKLQEELEEEKRVREEERKFGVDDYDLKEGQPSFCCQAYM